MVSGLMFQSIIRAEFIFVCALRQRSNVMFLHVAVWFSQRHLLKKPSFPRCAFLAPLSELVDRTAAGSFPGALSCSVPPGVCLCAGAVLF